MEIQLEWIILVYEMGTERLLPDNEVDRFICDRAAMSAREVAAFSWTTFRPVFDEIRL